AGRTAWRRRAGPCGCYRDSATARAAAAWTSRSGCPPRLPPRAEAPAPPAPRCYLNSAVTATGHRLGGWARGRRKGAARPEPGRGEPRRGELGAGEFGAGKTRGAEERPGR